MEQPPSIEDPFYQTKPAEAADNSQSDRHPSHRTSDACYNFFHMLLQALSYKETGNQAFITNDNETAIVKYRTALQLLAEQPEDPTIDQLKFVLNNNLAACHLKTQEYDLALLHASEALLTNPNHPKALYRKAKSELHLGDQFACTSTLNQLLKIDRSDREVCALLQQLLAKQQLGNASDCTDPDDAMRCIKEFSDETFHDFYATNLAVEVLSKWIVKTDKADYLVNRGLIAFATKALRRLRILNRQTKPEDENHKNVSETCLPSPSDCPTTTLDGLRLFTRLLQLVMMLLIDRKSVSNTTSKDQDDVDAYKRERALTMYDEKVVHLKIAERRKAVAEEFGTGEFIEEFVREYISTGVSDAGSDMGKIFRLECVGYAIDIVHYIYTLDDCNALKIMSYGLEAIECGPLRQKALGRLSIMCDDRRRLGLRVAALPVTHGLNLCISALVGMVCDEGQNGVEFALTAIFHLLCDKERSDPVDFNALLDKVILDRFTKSGEEQMIGFSVLNILWLADRDVVVTYSVANQLPLLALDTGLLGASYEDAKARQVCIEYLMNIVEVSATRMLLIPSIGGLLDYYDTNPELRYHLGGILAGLSLHEEDLRMLIFDKVDFLELSSCLLSAIEKTPRDQAKLINSLLRITFLSSVHSKYKGDLLSSALEWLGKLGKTMLGGKMRDGGESHYMYVGILWNLTRSQGDRDRLKKTKGGPDLDEGQLEQLRAIYEKLPKEAKADDGNQFDRGGDELAYDFKAGLIKKGDIVPVVTEMVTKTLSISLMKLGSMFIRNIVSKHQELRGACYSQGGYQIVKTAIENLKVSEETNIEDLRDLRQLVAHFGISIKPELFPYHQLMSMATNLGVLLKDSYELYQYEAALALTNLSSTYEEVRYQMWKNHGKAIFNDLILSDNEMLRGAGWELYCNMAVSDDVTRGLEVLNDVDYYIGISLQFAIDYENPRAWCASTGFLALGSSNLGLARIIARNEHFDKLITGIELALKVPDRKVEDRLVRVFLNIYEAEIDAQIKTKLTCLLSMILAQVSNENAQTISSILDSRVAN